ncbi:MAG: hypothetical protein ACRD47_01800 [Nitrososphaeraceae archaeon]
MSEENAEKSLTTGEMDRPFEEREEGSTSIDVTDKQISVREVPSAVQEEIPQEGKPQEMEQAQEKPRISRTKQKRRITSYLSSISKQVEKQVQE